ncbi:MAG: glycerate kinase, partial [Stackebrandtia sp.]
MSHILVAPDKFKGSLTAAQVAAHLAIGLRTVHPEAEVTRMPIADGGEGTVDAAVAAGFARRTFSVTGPLGDPVEADVAIRGRTAVVELAEASGLNRTGGVADPLRATSHGTGELLLAVRDHGCRRIVLGLGGSACTDGGAGMVQALGARLTDAAGADLAPGGAALSDLATVDSKAMARDWRGIDVILATDVDNPLRGTGGAAAVYGPQKGADTGDVDVLAAGLDRLATIVARDTGVDHADAPGAGAAGGVGYAALTFLRARQVAGVDLLLDLVGFADRLGDATLV